MQAIKKLFGAQDMTVGKPMTNLFKFSVPLLVGNVAQQLYSTADSMIVGNFAPEKEVALAAVGVTVPVINLLLVLFMAIATGAGIMVSQYFGAKDKENLSATIGTSLVLVVGSTILISVVGILLTPLLLTVISTPEAAFNMARDYLIIIQIGLLGSAFFNIASGILRGLGDSMWPLIYLVLAVTLNIGLDLWFVIGLKMSVAGAAWATIISQAISGALCLVRLFRMRDVIHLSRNNLKVNRALGFQLAKVGIPSGVQQAVMSLSMLMVQKLTNEMGALVMATSVAVMRVDGFAMLPNMTFGMAAATFVGQNIGANRMDRVERGSRDALKLSLCVSVTLSLLLIFFGRYPVGWFADAPQIVPLGVRAFRILAAGYIAVAIWNVYSGIMRGAGDTLPAMMISLGVNVALRTPLAYLLAYLTRSPEWENGSPDALYFSLLITWCAGALATYLWYRRGEWKNKSLIRRSASDL